MKEDSPREKFIILNDFYDSFCKMNIKIDLKIIDENILNPFREELKNIIPNLVQYDLTTIRSIVNKEIDARYYIITMDDMTYFENCDFSFDITRTAYKISEIVSGKNYKGPRGTGKQMIAQADELYLHYIKHSSGKPIVLCDDGVGTGGSLKSMVSLLKQQRIPVSKIFVLLNPNKIPNVKKIDIVDLMNIKGSYNWLSERDLFWGIHRSGITCMITGDTGKTIFGLPYTIDDETINKRIHNFGDGTKKLRKLCIKYNIKLWELIKSHTKKNIMIKDIERLGYLGHIFNESNTDIVEFINKVKKEDFNFNDYIS